MITRAEDRQDAGSTGGGERTVVSVSPTDVVEIEVIDDAAVNSADTLRGLLDEAGCSAGQIETLLRQLHESDQRSARASSLLQDRLRIGARMLKALQGQINAVDIATARIGDRQAALETLQRLVDSEVASFKNRLGSTVQGFERRFRVVVEERAGEMDDRLADHERRLARAHDRLTQLLDRAERLFERLEESEATTRAMADRQP